MLLVVASCLVMFVRWLLVVGCCCLFVVISCGCTLPVVGSCLSSLFVVCRWLCGLRCLSFVDCRSLFVGCGALFF